MTDMPETFETFLRIWIAENIGSLGSQTDATNLKYILRVRADELEKAATIKGFYGELAEAARPYGGIEGYVQHQFEKANPRKIARNMNDPCGAKAQICRGCCNRCPGEGTTWPIASL